MEDTEFPDIPRRHSYLELEASTFAVPNPTLVSPLAYDHDSTDDEVLAVEKIKRDEELNSESSEVSGEQRISSGENMDFDSAPPKTQYISTGLDKVQSPTLKRLVKMFSEPNDGLEGALIGMDTSSHTGYVLQKVIVRGHTTFGSEYSDYAFPSRMTHPHIHADESQEEEETERIHNKVKAMDMQEKAVQTQPETSQYAKIHPEPEEIKIENSESIPCMEQIYLRSLIIEEKRKQESMGPMPCMEHIYLESLKIEEKRKQENIQPYNVNQPPAMPEITETPKYPVRLQAEVRKNSIEESENPDQLVRKMQIASVQRNLGMQSELIIRPHTMYNKNELPITQSLPSTKQTPIELPCLELDDCDLDDEIDRLQRLLKQDEKRLTEETQWGQDAIKQITKLNDIRAQLQREIDGGNKPLVSEESKQLEKTDNELKRLTSMSQQIESELGQRQVELSYSEEYVERLKKQITQTSYEHRQATKEWEMKKKQRASLNIELKEMVHLLECCRMDKDDMNFKIRSLIDDIKSLTVTNAQLESCIEKEQASTETVEASHRKASNEVQLKNNTITALETELQQVTRVFGKAEDTYDDYKKRIKLLNETVKNLSYVNGDLDAAVKKERYTLSKEKTLSLHKRDELAKVLNHLESLKREQTMMLSNLSEAKKSSEDLRMQLRHQEDIVHTLTDGMITSQRKLDCQTQEIDHLKEQMSALTMEKDRVAEEYKKMSYCFSEKSQNAIDLEKAYDQKIQSMNNVVNLQRSTREQSGKNFQKDIMVARCEITKLSDILKQKEAQLTTYSNAIRELREIFRYSFMKSSTID